MSGNNGTFQRCACEWKDGKVVSFCGAHNMAADDRTTYQLTALSNAQDKLAEKYRKLRDARTGELSGFGINNDIEEYEKALIVDDICDGGGTFIGLAELIHGINPGMELSLYVSHGIFSKGFVELDKQFVNIFTSDFSFKHPDFDSWDKV